MLKNAIAPTEIVSGPLGPALPKQRAADLESAVSAACEKANTDKVIVFDGSLGWINLSPSMGKYLLERAPYVSKKVDEELMPMWLKQRGIERG